MLLPSSMSSCSKAPRGLFVLMRTDGIFTANALSPSSSSRQCPHDYSIRAGQNLPDKEFRYLRTVIVTAAVHWGLSRQHTPASLTFQHRAGVSPYTSTFVLAETCVFDKQFRGLFCCGPLICEDEKTPKYKRTKSYCYLSQKKSLVYKKDLTFVTSPEGKVGTYSLCVS